MEYPLYKPDDYETKLVIIYTLKKLKKRANYQAISQVVSSAVDVQYFEMQEYLQALVEMGSVLEKNEDEETFYSLTGLGEESCEFFSNRIPNSVRDKIEAAALLINNDTSDINRIYADYLPINENEYRIECGIMENKLKLIDFQMYAGPKERAKEMCAFFKEHPDEFYMHIVKFFEDRHDSDEN